MGGREHISLIMNPLRIAVIVSAVIVAQSAPSTPAFPISRLSWSAKLSQFIDFTFRGFRNIQTTIRELKASNQDLSKTQGQVIQALKKYTNVNITEVFGIPAKCESGWERFERRCYKMTVGTSTINSAVTTQKECERQGANLAQVRSEAHGRWLAKKVKSLNKTYTYIGGTDKEVEGVWRWLDGTLMKDGYTNWGNSGKAGGQAEDCLLMHNGGTWWDMNCNGARTDSAFVCEKDVYY